MTVRARLEVDVLQPRHQDAYDQFIRSQPASLFYHSWAYKEFLKTLIGCEEEYLVACEQGVIHGALPLMRAGSPGGSVYNSLPFFGASAGIIAGDDHAYAALADAYNEIATRPATRSATIVGSQFGPRRDEEAIAHNHVDPRISQMTALPSSDDPGAELLAIFDGSARRNVTKAQRAGVVVEADPGALPRLAEMHRAGMAAIAGTPKPPAFFELVPAFFKAHDDFDLYVARRDGEVIAALLLFYLGRTVEYFVPAVDPPHRSLQPLSLLIATAMTNAARRGFAWWNWGGTWTTQTGVYRFKRKWGALERPYAYYTQLNDATLRTWPRPRLLASWPHFFVLPFSALTEQRGDLA